MLEFIQHLSESWREGAIRACDGLRRGWSPVFPVEEDPPPTTPFEVVAEYGKLRLRYYRAQKERQPTPLLLVYALIKRPFILDFQPERSVVESLTRQGFNVYLTDWLPPTLDDAWRGFDAYVNHDLAQAVQFIRKREYVEQISLLGYCLGGLLGAIYSALSPATIKNYIALALPLDMSVRDIPAYALVEAFTPETIALITKTYGNCPAWIIHADFTAMAPIHHLAGKYIDLYRRRSLEGYTDTFDLFERWMHSDVPLAGQLFQELSNNIFRQNRLTSGQLCVGGRVVNLHNITCPVLNIVGEFDDVVHPRSSLPLLELVGSQDKQNLVFSAGHIGLAVSGAAHKKLWPRVGRWLKERSENCLAH
jgi:polyhydroxyalkanoate synthase